jgi:hypothetical protein
MVDSAASISIEGLIIFKGSKLPMGGKAASASFRAATISFLFVVKGPGPLDEPMTLMALVLAAKSAGMKTEGVALL